MSIAGGVENALKDAAKVKCGAVQVFTKNSNRWKGKPISAPSAEEFSRRAREFRPEFLISHTSYLINLASPGSEGRKKSIDAMIDELERAERLGLKGAVLHPGSHMGEGEEKGIGRIVRSLDAVHRATKGFSALTLLETTAGQGTNLGYRFEHLAAIIDGVKNPERVGVCLDTCHVFAAGYPIHERKGFLAVFREFDAVIGLEKLFAIHVNDSMKPFGSRRDRHEHIGKGEMGLEPFRLLVNDLRFRKIPMILETKKSKDLHEDVENLAVLRSLRKKK